MWITSEAFAQWTYYNKKRIIAIVTNNADSYLLQCPWLTSPYLNFLICPAWKTKKSCTQKASVGFNLCFCLTVKRNKYLRIKIPNLFKLTDVHLPVVPLIAVLYMLITSKKVGTCTIGHFLIRLLTKLRWICNFHSLANNGLTYLVLFYFAIMTSILF